MTKQRGTRNNKLSREDREDVEIMNINKSMDNLASKTQSEQIKFNPGSELKTESQKKLARKIKDNKIIFIQGPAGSGKTFATLRTALEIMKNDEKINEIILTKPILEAGNENIGFLKGFLEDKISPYMSSFYSNMEKMIGKATVAMLKQREYVKEKPLAFMRGDTFDNCICILDEAQNTTKNGLKLFISRLGQNSKMIIMGDTDQADIAFKSGEKSGLEDAFTRFKGLNGVSFHEFDEDDIVRNSILIDIMKRYKVD